MTSAQRLTLPPQALPVISVCPVSPSNRNNELTSQREISTNTSAVPRAQNTYITNGDESQAKSSQTNPLKTAIAIDNDLQAFKQSLQSTMTNSACSSYNRRLSLNQITQNLQSQATQSNTSETKYKLITQAYGQTIQSLLDNNDIANAADFIHALCDIYTNHLNNAKKAKELYEKAVKTLEAKITNSTNHIQSWNNNYKLAAISAEQAGNILNDKLAQPDCAAKKYTEASLYYANLSLYESAASNAKKSADALSINADQPHCAAQKYCDAADYYQKANNQKMKNFCKENEAKQYVLSGDLNKAITISQELSKSYQALNQTRSIIFNEGQLADYYLAINNEKDAQTALQKAIKLNLNINNIPKRIALPHKELIERSSSSQLLADNYKEALYKALKNLGITISDNKVLSTVYSHLNKLADSYSTPSNNTAALYELAAIFGLALGRNQCATVCFKKAADIYSSLNSEDHAIAACKTAIAIDLKGNKLFEAANSNDKLGQIYFTYHHFEKALHVFQKAYSYFSDSNNRDPASHTLSRIIKSLKELNRDTETLTQYDTLYQLFIELANVKSAVITLNSQAYTYQKLKLFNDAQQTYNKSAQHNIENNEFEFAAVAKRNRGNCFNALKDYKAAAAEFGKSAALHTQSTPINIASAAVAKQLQAEALKQCEMFEDASEAYIQSAEYYVKLPQKKSIAAENLELAADLLDLLGKHEKKMRVITQANKLIQDPRLTSSIGYNRTSG